MREQIFEAETVDAALEEASRQWNVDLDALKYEVVESEADDFWGFEGTSVKVRVRLPEDDGAAPAEEQAPAAASGQDQPAAPEAEAEEETPAMQPEPREAPEAPQAPQPPQRGAEAGAEGRPEADAPSPEAGAPSPGAGAPRSEAGAPSPRAQAGTAEERPEASAPAPEAARPEEGPGAPSSEARPQVETEEPSTPRVAARPEAEGDIEALIEGLLERVFDAIDFDCTAAATEGEDTIHVHIGGEDKKYLVDRKGRALSSLQLILNHAFRHRDVGDDKKIRVDAGDFRERREEELQDLAFQVAHRAKETGEDQETQPLNPYERRIVHLALADDPAITTRSQGNGFLKSVLISVQNKGGGQR